MQYIPSLQPLWVKQTKYYISGVNGSSIRQDTLCRHADSSGHPSAVKAERAAKHPNANIVGTANKMSSQNIADFETFFDTAHAICKRERPISDYPLALKYLARKEISSSSI